ncbi:folate-binding protein YgfZ [Aliikangiella marina]|uniref:Folate-binding protein YgfZ n=1 Tax=Aliikangiella marina TaxID=1712262 RepID=A0A545T6H8_9GAMM|nr:folate-binding protein YgfZ [Aliikangiella marina]TQV72829.1 folate-binding protein YgfZ [Aliikangiella marina]
MNQANLSDSIYSLSNMGCIRLTGEDTLKFLQGQITVNTEHFKVGELSLGAICNPQGRCISLFWASLYQDDVLLFQLQETIPETVAHLSKYAVFFKSKIEDVSTQYSIYGMFGQQMNSATKEQLESNGLVCFEESDSLIRFMIIESSASKQSDLQANANSDSQLFYKYLVEQGIPWLTEKSQSEFLPHNLNLPELTAVDFKKGCFTGQEVIARMQYKGKLKSHIQMMRSHNEIEAITPLSTIYADGAKAGEVICGAFDNNQTANMLVLLKDKYQECEIFRMRDENGPILELVSH